MMNRFNGQGDQRMKLLNVILILFVPVLNIGLNTAVKKTANTSGTFLGAFPSWGLLISYAIAMAIVLCLLGLYASGITLSRAILIMGAVSILGGSLFGVFYYHETLNIVEWMLFAVLSTLLLYRFFIEN
jgi:multidrug transporter EmrE-like cation transporter